MKYQDNIFLMRVSQKRIDKKILILSFTLILFIPFSSAQFPLNDNTQKSTYLAGWSEDIMLSSDSTNWSEHPDIASWGNYIHIVCKILKKDMVAFFQSSIERVVIMALLGAMKKNNTD
ncbi:MAG: hypothetical protein QME47_08110 [Candidatus Thermoplasmatota archaeon]|nr:hypothetical protein [Candidatus Thermoplasmatota archaeon]